MSKKQKKLDYFVPDSHVYFCHFMGCGGHKVPISEVVNFHVLFEIICCSIFERKEICNRCRQCFFCDRTDYLINEFNKLDRVNSADDDLYWSKVYFDLNLQDTNSFGTILGFEKISANRETAIEQKLL